MGNASLAYCRVIEVTNKREALLELHEQIADIAQSLECGDSIEDLQAGIASLQEELEETKEEKSTAEDELSEKEQEVKKLEGHIKTLEGSGALALVTSERDQAQGDLCELKEKLEAVDRAHRQATERNNELRAELAKERAATAKFRRVFEEVGRALDGETITRDERKDREIASLTDQVRDQRRAIDAAAARKRPRKVTT
jgi:chromosome segregation ATPase